MAWMARETRWQDDGRLIVVPAGTPVQPITADVLKRLPREQWRVAMAMRQASDETGYLIVELAGKVRRLKQGDYTFNYASVG